MYAMVFADTKESVDEISPRFLFVSILMTNTMVHIGKLIKQELERQDRTPTWLAKQISCDRTNVYYLFKQESLHSEMIERLSIALHHNFFQDLADGIPL